MNAPALLTRDSTTTWRNQRGVAISLGAGVVALGALFHQEVAAAVHVWMESTAYNHCFLVIPIAIYLVWDRRDTLHGFTAQPMPLIALAGIPLALVWLLAERLGIMEGRQLAAMSMIELLALAVLGWKPWWLLAGPLLYLYFLVPFGDFLTPRLQDVTTVFVQHGLNLLQIPAYITGYTIEIPEGTFYIAEACAGLRFLIASIAFGALYALLMYRGAIRRAVFIVVSIFVPIIANGMRAVGIIALGHVLGSAQAAATDHVLYGWLFFSIVILLLIALGLPFREDIDRPGAVPPPPPRGDGKDRWQGALLAVGIVLVLAAVGPVTAMQLDRAGPPAAGAAQALDFGPACTSLAGGAPPQADLPGRLASQRIACAGMTFDVQVDLLNTHTTSGPLLVAQRGLGFIPNTTHDPEFEVDWVAFPVPGAPANLWQLAHTSQPGPMVAVAMWVDGKPAGGGLRMRARMAWQSLVGAPLPPAVVAVRPEVDQYPMPAATAYAIETKLARVLAQADLEPQVARMIARAAGHGGMAGGAAAVATGVAAAGKAR